jgi:Colicin V production protein
MGSVGHIEASAQWQTGFFLLAGAWILLSVVRGWGQGLLRQVTAIFALFAAGFLVLRCTGWTEEFLRPHVPAWILLPVAVAVIWVVSFNSIILIGHLLFRRTNDYESPSFRLICGLGGAAIGLAYGFLFVFCMLIGVKIVGRIAENQAEIQEARNENPSQLILNLAKLKRSVELGYGRRVIDSVDPLPRRFYRELDLYTRIAADPEAIRKLAESQGFRRVWESPRFFGFRNDPEIMADVQRGNVLGVLTNRNVVALLNDPQLRGAFIGGDLDTALKEDLTSRDEGKPSH